MNRNMVKTPTRAKKTRSAASAPIPMRSIVAVPVEKIEGAHSRRQQDFLAVEEPLQIRLAYGAEGARVERDLSITMRTPGNDRELAAGFLLTEGILQRADQILEMRQGGPDSDDPDVRNTVVVELRPEIEFDLAQLDRHFYVSSSCGVCGKASIDAVRSRICPVLPKDTLRVDAALIHRLPQALRDAQAVFEQTGGLHAAALFDPEGKLLSLREDVGRHNAVDKLIGAEFLKNALPLHERMILVSGRASFELVQKALAAGIPALFAVGAPSSLAVELARRFQMTLAGFVREQRYNVYSGAFRIRQAAPE